MIAAATGHRPNKLGGYGDDVQRRLRALARQHLIEIAPAKAISGLALGWDKAWAQAAIDLRIPLIAAVPFPDQDSMWPGESRREYREILEQAAEVVTLSKVYSTRAMHKRDEWMVDNCGHLAALYNGMVGGGTAYTVGYAIRQGMVPVNLWPRWIDRGFDILR